MSSEEINKPTIINVTGNTNLPTYKCSYKLSKNKIMLTLTLLNFREKKITIQYDFNLYIKMYLQFWRYMWTVLITSNLCRS